MSEGARPEEVIRAAIFHLQELNGATPAVLATSAALDALVAEHDRYREALAIIATRQHSEVSDARVMRKLARAALDEDSGRG